MRDADPTSTSRCSPRSRRATRRPQSSRAQWHEHPPPQPPDEPVLDVSVVAGLFDSPDESLLESPDLSADLAAPSPFLPSAFSVGLPELLKSVAYQPLPLSWNPTAEISLLNEGLWHCGQSDSGASESFCSTSSSWPQAPHRYS